MFTADAHTALGKLWLAGFHQGIFLEQECTNISSIAISSGTIAF
jgi:hypothetical protein